MNEKQIKSKRRRLDAEIEQLRQFIADAKAMIKHDPYKEDLPSLREQLEDAKYDLAQAEAESNQDNTEREKRIQATLAKRKGVSTKEFHARFAREVRKSGGFYK